MNTEAIRKQAAVVDAARKVVSETERQIAQVSARHGQDCAVIYVNGVEFKLTALNPAYRPQVVAGMEEVQRLCTDMLRTRLHFERTRLEGAEWTLRQMAKGN